MRLDKLIAMSGVSRKDAKKLISDGRVKVNGACVRSGAANVSESDDIEIDGAKAACETELHIMLHKPAGVLTATEDSRGEKTVADLLPDAVRKRRIGPVGRLDKDVTGLVLLTTDGQLAHRLISPKWEHEKEYIAHVEGCVSEECISVFEKGVELRDFTAKPARLEIIEKGETESVVRVFVTEGKYHQVKRMLASVGHPVTALHRNAIAGIPLDPSLAPGEWRPLTQEEKDYFYRITESRKS